MFLHGGGYSILRQTALPKFRLTLTAKVGFRNRRFQHSELAIGDWLARFKNGVKLRCDSWCVFRQFLVDFDQFDVLSCANFILRTHREATDPELTECNCKLLNPEGLWSIQHHGAKPKTERVHSHDLISGVLRLRG